MNWELTNGITGIISAICSVIGLGYFGSQSNEKLDQGDRVLSFSQFMAFLLASSGWALLCLCGLWLLEPFGPFVTDVDYQKFYGAVLTFPSLAVFMFGFNLLKKQRR